MALLDKLFPNRIFEYDNREARKRDRPHQITPEQVRLLLFKECDWRGRKLLFDSSTIQKVPAGKNDKPNRQMDEPPCILEVSDGFTYVYKGPAVDASVLGEMIFGAVAMNYKGVSLKIHIMDDPRRLMCTKVFCVPTSRRYSRAEKRPSEVASGDVLHGSKPMTVPALREEGVALSFSLDRGDSGFCGDVSPHSSVGSTYDYFSMFDIWDENNSQEDFFFHCPPGRKLSTSSNGSWQRRTFQNIVTRFDLGHQPTSSSNLLSVPTAASNASDSQVYSNSSTSGTNESLSSCVNLPQRKNKLGLAVLITVSECAEMDEVRKCVEHSPQLQALVCRLRLATLAAGAGNNFVSTLHRASTDAARCLSDLLYGPRLQPAWLRLVTGEPRAASKMADTLLADLCSVLSVGDTKHTNFFISTLLTYVLTYHLGWVTTVSPYDTPQLAPPAQEPRRPYNALWAQLGDLCGAIGFPPRAARTIISGNNNSYVNRLLVVLTYFVRSGDVRRTDFTHQFSGVRETKVINVDSEVISGNVQTTLKRTATVNKLGEVSGLSVAVNSDSFNTLASDVSMRRVTTLADFDKQLSNSTGHLPSSTAHDRPASSPMKRTPTMLLPIKAASDSSLSSVSDEPEPEKSVVFVLGDNEKLVGLKNKSNNPRSVKKSSKVHNEPIDLAEVRKADEKTEVCSKDNFDVQSKNTGSPSKCCGQTLQHSKPIKHSGFKFEFDKYPQIVTNYMKSKNLEILDRHYIGKPGNLKLANFHFDPTTVPPIQEERCEICYKCQQIESMLQTPTNASEMEYMNDMPRQAEPQHAIESIVSGMESHREISPKTFVRERKQNTIVVNINRRLESPPKVSVDAPRERERTRAREASVRVRRVVELEMPSLCAVPASPLSRSGFDASLLGGVTDHYVPDLILQGTNTKPHVWESDLRRDLDMTSHLNKGLDSPVQAVAIVGDTNTWEVRVVGRSVSAGGMSSLVGAMLDALPAMRKANVPALQCLSFLESKLREFCILSKTLADMLMSTDFCDIATLTKSLNIDVNDVPLLLAVASTHTPQVATRYGISYR